MDLSHELKMFAGFPEMQRLFQYQLQFLNAKEKQEVIFLDPTTGVRN
jgi:hypothetical protein